ncbi:MAG: HEAT repeat domain-containing protein [Phycisphaeraceae bacterium]|nr:HEAT repeat domain-containing protein [Phycisphaeraceae bacterium]
MRTKRARSGRQHAGWWGLVFLAAMLAAGCAGDGGSSKAEDTTLFDDFVAQFKSDTPTQVASEAFNTYDADLRRSAVVKLSDAPFGGEEPYLRMYRYLIDDPDPTVRAVSVMALGRHGTVADAETIATRLADDTPVVRWEAAKALQQIHNPAVAKPLSSVLGGDSDADVRMAAADALGQYAQRSVIDALIRALDDADYGVQQMAWRSLKTVTGQNLGVDPALWLNWTSSHAGSLFAAQKEYRYLPYRSPHNYWSKKVLFQRDKPADPQLPRGWQGPGAGAVAARSDGTSATQPASK